MKRIGIIIPARPQNEYHAQGDLAPFGDITLLDWKISQVKRVVPNEQIYITSPAPEIGDLAGRRGVNFIPRRPDLSLAELITGAIEQIREEVALWANVTTPFVGPADYRDCIERYQDLESEFDSLAAATRLDEYMLYKNKPLNFKLQVHISRRAIEPLYQITNGCFIIARARALELQSYFGRRPHYHLVDRLTAVEIKDLTDLAIANDLIARYFREKEIDAS